MALFDVGQKGHFFEKKNKKKWHQTFHHPHPISFLSALHQNKGLHNFHKRTRLGPDWVRKEVNFFKCFASK